MDLNGVSDAYKAFLQEAPGFSEPWMEMVSKLDQAGALDKKTGELAYLAVLAAAGLTSGLPFHVKHVKSLGATREEVIGAVLTGLPAVGSVVIQALPAALQAFDE